MAAIRERTKKDGTRVFHVQVRQAGFPARTASFPTKRLAERWAKTIEAEMIEGRHFRSAESRRRSVGEAVERYMLEVAPKKKDDRNATLGWWKRHIGELKLGDVTPAILVEHRGKLERETFTRAKPGAKGSTLKAGEAPRQFKRSNGTINRYLAHLSHLLKIARKEWHWTGHNPFDGVSKLDEKKTKKRRRALSEDERSRLFVETKKDLQLHAFTLTGLSSTARVSELLNLTDQDVEIGESEARLTLRETKNSEPRTAWVQGEAFQTLKAHMAQPRPNGSDRIFYSVKGKRYDYAKPFKAACAAAKIKNFTFHAVRHTSATLLAREGATEQQLKAIGGWKSNVVADYVHMAAEDAKSVVVRMNKKILG